MIRKEDRPGDTADNWTVSRIQQERCSTGSSFPTNLSICGWIIPGDWESHENYRKLICTNAAMSPALCKEALNNSSCGSAWLCAEDTVDLIEVQNTTSSRHTHGSCASVSSRCVLISSICSNRKPSPGAWTMTEMYFSQFQRLEDPRSRCQPIRCLVETPWFANRDLSCRILI